MSRYQALVHVGLVGLAGLMSGPGCSFDAPAIDHTRPVDALPDTEPTSGRATAGLVAFWRFDEGTGDRANDSRMAVVSSPPMMPIPLPISAAAGVTWRAGGLSLDAPVRAGTPAPPAPPPHVSRDVLATGEVTLEVWASPAAVSQGDGIVLGQPNYALLLSISPSYAYHNAMIAQVGDRWQGRVLTAATTANALPVIETPAGTVTGTEPVHLVLVASATERALYVNGTR